MEPTPIASEVGAFYKAALAGALFLDREGPDRLLDGEADAAWRAYDGTLPSVIRFDLVLKNLSMLYPGAFAPGPVFQLPGWYDDDPWGVGFSRPPRDELEALFRKREVPADLEAALARVREAWMVRAPGPVTFGSQLTPATQLLVCGAAATSAVASALGARANHQVRSQTLLVSRTPASRHLLAIAAALGRQQGVPRVIVPMADAAKAAEAARQIGAPPATVLVRSSDATADEVACATGLADLWAIRERFEV